MNLTLGDIKKILPHREPLLLVSEAELTPGVAVDASIYLDPQWPIFQGHFPEYPVLPGIYITESMAQAADLILLTIPGNEHKYPLFMGIRSMRFLRSAVPGDRMTLSARISCDAGNGMYDCDVTALVNGKKIATWTISLALKA